MRRLLGGFARTLTLGVALLGAPAMVAATPMLTSSGVTSATTSTCPSSTPGLAGQCSSGWFRVEGAARYSVHIRSSAGSTASVQIRWRASSSDATIVLKTITDPSATEVYYVSADGVGEISINVATWNAGTIKATLNAITFGGIRLW